MWYVNAWIRRGGSVHGWFVVVVVGWEAWRNDSCLGLGLGGLVRDMVVSGFIHCVVLVVIIGAGNEIG